MACARPLVSVVSAGESAEITGSTPLPAVCVAPIRIDVIHHVHRDMAKNSRQAYAVSKKAGHQTSAESWGTGRAVSRIPRVPGGGTHRAGQGAFGNMCRGGRMFAPTKVWRRWHRKINVPLRRHAVAASLAGSSVTSLVMARGHNISSVPEIPLVVSSEAESIAKTSAAVKLLKSIGADADSDKARHSKRVRSGKGKMRNRRYTSRRGPLVIYENDEGITKAFRNLPGVELACVDRLNLLQLAPGGHVGRFCIWTQGAFDKLDALYGTYRKPSSIKSKYSLPVSMVTNTDIARIINSDEIQSVVNPAKVSRSFMARKRNPLKNFGAMLKLNPYSKVTKRQALMKAGIKPVVKSYAKISKKPAAKKAAKAKPSTPKAKVKKAGKAAASPKAKAKGGKKGTKK